jgi:FixJ family two-component response regulator
MADEKQRFMKEGFSHFFVKPIDVQVLLNVMKEAN